MTTDASNTLLTEFQEKLLAAVVNIFLNEEADLSIRLGGLTERFVIVATDRVKLWIYTDGFQLDVSGSSFHFEADDIVNAEDAINKIRKISVS